MRFVEPEPAHLDALDRDMLPLDRIELDSLSWMPTRAVLQASVEASLWARIALHESDEAPVALFGLAGNVGSGIGEPWFVGASELEHHSIAFFRRSKAYVADMLETFPRLQNRIWVGNLPSIKWLKWLGFHFDRPEPYGMRGLAFHRFWMEAPHV